MSIHAALHQQLLDRPGITNLVGQRIAPNKLPKGWDPPYIVYHKLSNVHERSSAGVVGLAHGRWQVSCYATDYQTAADVGEQVRLCMEAFRGEFGTGDHTHTVYGSFLENDFDQFFPSEEDDEGTYGVLLDFMIWHTEDSP